MTYRHVHVSEVPDSPVVECTIASGLMVARAALYGSPKQPPATAAEREALRAACGVPDNSGARIEPDLLRGMRIRYGLFQIATGLPIFTTAPDGTYWAVQGDYHSLPAHYQRWDRQFASHAGAGHCVCVRKEAGALLWDDPLAPWGAYSGEPVTPAVVAAYFRALPGARVTAGRVPAVVSTHSLVIRAGAQVKSWAPSGGCLTDEQVRPFTRKTSAPCDAEALQHLCAGGTATAVKVVGGTLSGRFVWVASPGVSIEENT